MKQMLEQFNQLLNTMTATERRTIEQNRFGILYEKAYAYLKMDPEIYLKKDVFEQPDFECTEVELELIAKGCQQLLEGIGLTADKPFTELGIAGFRLLFELFHFEQIDRVSYIIGKGKFLDEIKFRHLIDGSVVTYYNQVVYDF